DHPSWPVSSRPDWTADGDHPSWPREGGGSAPRGREPTAAPRHDPRSPTAPPPAPVGRGPVPAGRGPGAAGGGGDPRAARGRGAGAAPPYYEVAVGDGPVQVMLPPTNQEWPAGTGTGQMPQLSGEGLAELRDPVRQDAAGSRSADSVRLAERILSDADSQAVGIRQEAWDHANAIREAAEREAEDVKRQAAYQADAAREAERQAEEIKRQAEYQADAIREAAAREADELRAGAIRLSAELGQVAA